MSKAINARTIDHTVEEKLADHPEYSQSQSEVSPKSEIVPYTEEQEAADEPLVKEIEEYHALYGRGDIGETSYTSTVLHRLAGRYSIVRELQRAFTGQILRYMKPESDGGYGLSLEEALKKAESWLADTTATKLFNELKYRGVESLSWFDFERLFRLEPAAAEALWNRLKTEARADFESGSFAARIFETTEWRHDPWRRAQYVGIRDGFIDEYKPRGAIELSMIEMAVTAFFLYYYWTDKLMHRSDTKALPDLFTTEERRRMESHKGYYEWVPPRVHEQDAIEQAAQMADRFRRQYLSVLRALRDYRRWGSPVIINNEGQVNIAEGGSQQLNVQQKSQKRAKNKKCTSVAPKSRRLKAAK
jgi:hypothetical protein